MRRLAHFTRGRRVVEDKPLFQHGVGGFFRNIDPQQKDAFLFTPTHGEQPMRRHFCHRFLPVEIVSELGGFGRVLETAEHAGCDDALRPERFPQGAAHGGVVAHAFGEDVSCPAQCLGRVFDCSCLAFHFVGVPGVNLRLDRRVRSGILCPEKIRKGLQTVRRFGR